MNALWEDYYSILQVHNKAGDDVITGAYRLLSKKYHPDVNKSKTAEELMKRLNIAYGILSDTRKRALYDAEWSRRARGAFPLQSGAADSRRRSGFTTGAVSPDIQKAGEQIENYYTHIKNGEYNAAYDCISAYDRSRIKRGDFCKWREIVGKACELRNFDIEFFKTQRFMRTAKKVFDVAYEFTVKICERDVAKNGYTDYKTSKIAVCENGCYGVYLGYADVKPFFAAFERSDGGAVDTAGVGAVGASRAAGAAGSADVVDAKAMLEYWKRDQALHDPSTGMLNLTGFLDAAGSEVSRYKRHGSVFSIAVFEARDKRKAGASGAVGSSGVGAGTSAGAGVQTPDSDIINAAGQFLSGTLRDIDIACHWKNGKFIALLAETDAAAALKAVNRICNDYNKTQYAKNEPKRYCALYAGVSEYDGRSINSTIKKCALNLAFAKLGSRRNRRGNGDHHVDSRGDRFVGRSFVKGAVMRLRAIKLSGRLPRVKTERKYN